MRSIRKTGIALLLILGLISTAFAGGGEEAPAEDATDDTPEFQAYSGADGRTAQEIIEEADTSLMPSDVRADVTMTLVNRNGSSRVREISFISKEVNDLNRMVMHFRAPADVDGTGFLLIESDSGETDMWLYLPDLNRVRRIVSSSRTDSFMGSDLSYSDMENMQLNDYRFVRFQDDSVNGEACYVVQATPVSETVANDTGYGRIIYFISTEKRIPIQAVFFDRSGVYFKRMHVHTVEAIGDTWVPTQVEVEDLGQDHRTIMVLRNVQIDTNPDDSFFTQQYLQRGN